MKLKILLLFLLSGYLIQYSAQITVTAYPQFSELRGMEDQAGNTHLFYRKYSRIADASIYYSRITNNIYHLSLASGTDTLFFQDYANQDNMFDAISWHINDFVFWHNDPSLYIAWGLGCEMECSPGLIRFDQEHVNIFGEGCIILLTRCRFQKIQTASWLHMQFTMLSIL